MRPKVHAVQSLKFSRLYAKRRRRCSLNIPRDRQTRRRPGATPREIGTRRHPLRGVLLSGTGRRSVRRRIRLHHPVLSARHGLRRADERPGLARAGGLRPGPPTQVPDQPVLPPVGIPRPNRSVALAWYRDTRVTWGTSQALTFARLPSVLMGAVGCVAIFWLGVLVKDEPTGWIAAALLAVNPLYRLHAHRAMSEAPCEAFMLLSLALGLWGWRAILTRPSVASGLVAMVGAGLLAGLAILAKFNGIIALMCFSAWCVLGVALSGIAAERKLVLALGTAMACLSAWFVFVELNPSMTAHPAGRIPVRLHYLADMNPWERFLFLVDYRRDMARGQQRMFPHNALESLMDRASVVAIQGFGRFGPLGPRESVSTRRYDLSQDFGATIWLPIVLAGLASAMALGRRQRREATMPTAWCLVAWAGVSVAVVTAYLPMAWDRYQLPIQAPAALLASLALRHVLGLVPAQIVSARGEPMLSDRWLRLRCSVFLLLIASYAFFWHSRDWNSASRLMLTYALVDRGTVCLDGLDRQTGRHRILPWPVLLRQAARLLIPGDCPLCPGTMDAGASSPPARSPGHRLLAGRLLGDAGDVRTLHCPDSRAPDADWLATWAAPRARGVLVGLTYGLATPAYVYATLCLRPPALGVRLARRLRLLLNRGRSPRMPPSSRPASSRPMPRSSSSRSARSRRSSVSTSWFSAWPARPAARRPGLLRGRRDCPNPDPARLQPPGVRLALGHGLLSPRHGDLRQGPQPREPAGARSRRTGA